MEYFDKLKRYLYGDTDEIAQKAQDHEEKYGNPALAKEEKGLDSADPFDFYNLFSSGGVPKNAVSMNAQSFENKYSPTEMPEEKPLSDEGFFDIFRPTKDAILSDMEKSGVDYKGQMAFDLLTPDSINFLNIIRNSPSAIKKMADDGDEKVISLLDHFRKKSDKDPSQGSFRQKNVDTRSRDEKIKDALNKQSDFNPYASERTDTVYNSRSFSPEKSEPRTDFDRGIKSRRGNVIGISNSPIPNMNTPEEVSKKQAFNRLLDRYSDSIDKKSSKKKSVNPMEKTRSMLEENAKKVMDEPYAGRGYDNAIYASPEVNDLDILQPIPSFGKVDPQGHLGKYVEKGGADPFAWLDTKYGITKDVLKENYGKPLKISTRSDLIAHDDYLQALDPRFHKVEIHMMSDNDRINRIVEPGAPSVKRRLAAAIKLLEAGIPVTIVHDVIEGVEESQNSLNMLFSREYRRFPSRVNKIKPTKNQLETMKKVGLTIKDN